MANSNTAEKYYLLGSDEAVNFQKQPQSPSNRAQPLTSQSPTGDQRKEAASTLTGKRSNLNTQLTSLATLVANITESYTTAIFRARGETLELAAVHTLSRDFIADCRIGFGCGLVGWTAENGVRISVCPFENDATTLLYYSAEQDLKSFIAVPIIGSDGTLHGVISCDSKKSYAFAKVTEKILTDCAKQAATLIELHKQLGSKQYEEPLDLNELNALIETLRVSTSEDELLQKAANVSQSLVSRDALFVITSDLDECRGTVHTSREKISPTGHHLLETICLHKKILCSDRSIHVPALNDIENRSFLSVPFRCLERDAGSFNALSRPGLSFDAKDIEALEAIAKAVGERLEYLRLRNRHHSSNDTVGLKPWAIFRKRAQQFIDQALAANQPVSLLRFHVSNFLEIEQQGGIDSAVSALQQLMRLIDQVKPGGSVSGYLHGSHIVLVLLSSEVDQTRQRLSRLLDRLGTPADSPTGTVSQVGKSLRTGLREAIASSSKDGAKIEQLLKATISALASQNGGTKIEEVSHASRW